MAKRLVFPEISAGFIYEEHSLFDEMKGVCKSMNYE